MMVSMSLPTLRSNLIVRGLPRMNGSVSIAVPGAISIRKMTVGILIELGQRDASGLEGKVVGDSLLVAAVHAEVETILGFFKLPAEGGRSRAAVPDHAGVFLFVIGDEIDEQRKPPARQFP